MHRSRSLLLALPLGVVLAVACGSKPNDDAITNAIKAKMFSDPSLKSSSVSVVSKGGIVTLTGEVRDDSTRAAARAIASETNGVKQVIDSTTLPAPPVVASEPPSAPAPEPPPPPKPAAKKKVAKAKPEPVAAAPASDETTSADNNPQPPPEPPPAPSAAPAPAPPPPPPPPQPVSVTIPEGSIVTIRTIDAVDSSVNSTGQTFRASLDAPVVVGDSVVLPRGLNVKLRLVNASSAGKFKGQSELTISLDSVTYQGKTYSLQTSDVQTEGSSRGKRSAAVIGGGTVLGALIGGLAGGGKGAAIGAGLGAGGGTAVQAATRGQQVKIPSETRLDFTLHAPVLVTYLPPKKSVPATSTDANPGATANQPAPDPNPSPSPNP
jgi:outer membrane biosynthesis protein TonB